jgi:hypothetical protein
MVQASVGSMRASMVAEPYNLSEILHGIVAATA